MDVALTMMLVDVKTKCVTTLVGLIALTKKEGFAREQLTVIVNVNFIIFLHIGTANIVI